MFDIKIIYCLKSNMNNPVNQSIVCEQIDVAVLGPKSVEIIQMLIHKKINKVDCRGSNSYLNVLKSLLTTDQDTELKVQNTKPENHKKIHKFTTNVCTASFWLQYNFYLFDEKVYDPILGNILRNGMSICILTNDEDSSSNWQLKELISFGTNHEAFSANQIRQGDTALFMNPVFQSTKQGGNTKNRNQLLIEAKIFNRIHDIKLNQFTSVLSLKLLNNGRIVEETNNLRLTRNQILRWTLDRHFQNYHKIRLREELSDELEQQTIEDNGQYCQLI